MLHQATNGWLNPTLVLAALLGAGTFFLVFGPGRQRPADLGLRWAALPFGLAATFAVWLAMNASTALATISLKKISWSEYKNFLITGKIFSVVTPILPVFIRI